MIGNQLAGQFGLLFEESAMMDETDIELILQ
jgi:hypothetical protein